MDSTIQFEGLENTPLQPESLSIPMTWDQEYHKHDIFFYVIFGCNRALVIEFVEAMAIRLYSVTTCDIFHSSITELIGNEENHGIDTLRAMFFLLLNVDMPFKEYVCDIANTETYATALNLNMADVTSRISYSMVSTIPIPPSRNLFFITGLKKIINDWMSNEFLTSSDLINKIKEFYLVS
jgi:hypothetical protein